MGRRTRRRPIRTKGCPANLELVEKGSAEIRKRKRAKESDADSRKVVQVSIEDKKKAKLTNKRKIKNAKNYEAWKMMELDQSPFETQEEIEIGEVLTRSGKSKKAKKKKKKDRNSLEFKTLEREVEADQADVFLISSGVRTLERNEKFSESSEWIMEYHQSRPGLKVLQQRIDQFMEKKEKEARAADGGWTVVVHHKGRKKTTDAESGITVGSVAQAALEDKEAKKKRTEVAGLDFYRFQRKEAQRNEIMMLQSKFEQDKKRIQQLRAARKFRPY
ncbi:cylicin-1-like [Pyrus ussuriensis x Pyrus communis]|uniref:Cylicin-1-like n=1 Tax=Pyrus ussuriensis x Pyrus communis TaxID=2448454 RepID=A0A5N5G508_9ROSA|nr:cylicin-1-like [Pyrus ussuriensis x Pyrus communis]